MVQIYGIDLASEKFDVSFLDETGNAKHFIVKNRRPQIEKFLDKLPADAHIVAEHTGVYGDLLLMLADMRGLRISYVPGYEIKHSQGLSRGKSDPGDAARIREYGERHYDKLHITHFPSESLYKLHELYSTRRLLVSQRKQLLATIECDKHRPMRSDKAQEIKQTMLEELSKQIRELESEMNSIICNDPKLKKSSEIVQSIPGIGLVTSTELIIKTNNFERVATSKKCATLAGIAPFPNATGKCDKGNHVSHMGDMELKSLLFMCSRSSILNFEKMRLYKVKKYDTEHKHFFLVMNNIANKLLKILYAMIKSGEKFNPSHVPTDPRLKLVC